MHAGVRAPVDRALIQDGPELRLVTASGVTPPRWRAEVRLPGMPALLRLDERDCLLWYATAPEGPQAVMLDGSTGTVRWAITAGGPGLDRPDPRDAAGPGPAVFATLGPETLYVVHAGGEVTALSLADGREVWQRRAPGPLTSVTAVLYDEMGLVLAGERRPQTAGPEHGLVVLDPADGRTLLRMVPQRGGPVAWVAPGPLGSVIYGTASSVEGVDLPGGTLLFASVSGPTARGWVSGQHVVVESPAGAVGEGPNPLRAVRTTDGAISAPFDVPIGGEWNRVELEDLHVDDGRLFAHYGQRIVRYDAAGTVLGADMVSDRHDYRWLFVAEDRLVLVSRFKREIVAGEAGRQAKNIYRLYALSSNCKLLGEPYQLPPLGQRLQRAVLIDGWLLLSTPSQTLALALSDDVAAEPGPGD